jgi:hypothetical protein
VTVDEFVAAHRPDWQRLEELLGHMHGGRLRGLSDDDVLAFGHLYRQSTSDLAVARRDYPYDPVMSYLKRPGSPCLPFCLPRRGHSAGAACIARRARPTSAITG